MRAALLDSSGRVSNIIVLDADSNYDPPEEFTMVILDGTVLVNIGDLWNGGDWTPPEVPEPEEPPVPGEVPMTIDEKIAEMQSVIDMLVSAMLEG